MVQYIIYQMEIVQDSNKPTFLGHVFSTTDEDKSEMLNVLQYVFIGIIPVIILNKTIQRFVPEADPDKSSLELLVEISVQLVIIFIGLILIHRIITYIPTYSGYKYEALTLTNIILAFLVIVLSIQSKIGLKANILVDRVNELWNGPTENMSNENGAKKGPSNHNNSQADHLDNSHVQEGMFPPAPVAVSRPSQEVQQQAQNMSLMEGMGPMAANSVLGGSFGASF